MKELDSYLNDHLAGSVSALELLEHWARIQEGEQVADFFRDIKAEVRQDQEKLREVMHSLGIEESDVRQARASAAEKVGRVPLERCAEQQIERIDGERMPAVPQAFADTNCL